MTRLANGELSLDDVVEIRLLHVCGICLYTSDQKTIALFTDALQHAEMPTQKDWESPYLHLNERIADLVGSIEFIFKPVRCSLFRVERRPPYVIRVSDSNPGRYLGTPIEEAIKITAQRLAKGEIKRKKPRHCRWAVVRAWWKGY